MDYPIQVAAKRAGLTAVTLRAWERRYDGVTPHRDNSGRRRYSEELVTKLTLLSALVKNGYRIGEIANLDIPQLRDLYEKLTRESGLSAGAGSAPRRSGDADAEDDADTTAGSAGADSRAPSASGTVASRAGRSADAHVAESVDAVRRLDDIALHRSLEDATLIYGRLDLVDRFMFPLVHAVEERVEAGELKSVHESFLRTALRSVLASLFAPRDEDSARPVVIIAGPRSEHHEIGLVASAIHAYAAGWHPVVLGSSIPAEEIVEAARATSARAVVLSLVSKRYDFGSWEELTRAHRALAEEMPVYFGGRMPERLVDDLKEAGLHHLTDMDELRAALAAQPA